MGLKALLGCALHLWIASSLVLKTPQKFPGITTNHPTALDASSKTPAYQLTSIPLRNSQPRISDSTSLLSPANTTSLAVNTTLRDMAVSCNEAHLTRPQPASLASCQNAWEHLKPGGNDLTFGDRAAGEWNVALPLRTMSGKRAANLLTSVWWEEKYLS